MYINGEEVIVAEKGVAQIFMHDRSQVVRLPLEFRLPGDRVRVRRVKEGILLEPIVTDLDAWFGELDRFKDVPFMEDGRRQPAMPDDLPAPRSVKRHAWRAVYALAKVKPTIE